MPDQKEEWEAFSRGELAKGRCPASGGHLVRREYFDGPRDPSGPVLACGICDCFGYSIEEVQG